jgi:hypothetical protein
MTKVWFSADSIRQMERNVRRSIEAGATGTPEDECFIRIGRDVLPRYMRFVLEEANRDTPADVLQAGLHQLMAWMLAQRCAVLTDGEQRRKMITAIGSMLVMEAIHMAEGQTLETMDKVSGEFIKGSTQ